MEHIDPLKNETVTKVKVVNELKAQIENSSDSPLPVKFDPSLIAGSGSSSALKVQVSQTNTWAICRPTGTNLNLHFSSVQVVNSGVGYIFPIDMWVYTLTSSAVSNNVAAVYGSYSSRFMSATSIIIFYETVSSSGTVTASSYSSSDV